MRFDDFDTKMRRYETADDVRVIPDTWMVVRLDGRSFTRLTKDILKLDAPFDMRFRDAMVDVMRHLTGESGFRVLYGWTSSDEISLLIAREDETFGRKTRKIVSVLAGEASAMITAQLCSIKPGVIACMDARISQLPTDQLVVDYFRWRQADAVRNALNSWVYWTMRYGGISARSATQLMQGLSVAEKNEFLFRNDVNFNDVPLWQRRGVGMAWGTTAKVGFNPKTGQQVVVDRRSLNAIADLPTGDEYGQLIRSIIATA